jgi:iron complex transport system permease protein
MTPKPTFKLKIMALGLCTLVLMFINLGTGYQSLPWASFFSSALWQNDIIGMRFGRVWAMLLAGIAVPTSGFILQEYFKNPLAGPSVLGISSGASLAVALFICFLKDLMIFDIIQEGALCLFAMLGSSLVMLLLLAFSKLFKDKTYLIIFGFLMASLAGAFINVLEYFSSDQNLKNYIMWSFSSNTNLTTTQNIMLSSAVLLGLCFSFRAVKMLTGYALGEAYAISFGVDLRRLKWAVLISSSLLCASVTAFVGPILFIGIIIPHFARVLWNPSQLWKIWLLSIFFGMMAMQFFSIMAEKYALPINVLSSFLAVPILLGMLIKQSKNTL